ncbi:DNA damage-binding protein 2 [Halocaridina rubra]|uniref:DNA damage-binding protein 2 n=1 Tax=Halocaridina rubra TaxID=373956 RepID=A0AAN8WUP2_HALRR
MASKRPRGTKKPKNYKEEDSDDDFDIPRNTATPKASTSKKTSLKPKKSKSNKENVQKANDSIPWLDRHPFQPKNNNIAYSSCHLLHFLRNRSFGTTPPFWQDQSVNNPLMSINQKLQVYKSYMDFDRRVTALAWHPENQNVVVVCAKSGDIVLWDFENEKKLAFINGTGANGSIQALKFDYVSSDLAYTASVNGTVACHDFTGRREENIFLNTWDLNHWYTSLDLLDKNTLMVGDNKGQATILSTDGSVLWGAKLHKQKITHLECCPSNSHYIISASVDRTTKVWDVRSLKSQKSCLYTLEHEAPVNSAYFSSTGNCVLTTDQKMELRVYAGPSFALMQKIPHPHRHFQHLTPIKAIWHPLRDIIVVGRYPDKEFPAPFESELRSIDFFDSANGKLLHQHIARDLSNKIVSLNLFNRTGDQMLSAAGMYAYLWKPRFPEQKREKANDSGKNDDNDDDDDDDDKDNDDSSKKKRKRKPSKKLDMEKDLNKKTSRSKKVSK